MNDLSPDQNRRLESVIRFGTIAEVDVSNAQCRANTGGILTDWCPWLERRAGQAVQDWNPPSAGEQCIILSPSGETGEAAIITGLFQDAVPAPENSADVTARHWQDGAILRYDHAAHEHLLDVPAGGKIVLHIGATTLTLTADGARLDTPALTVNAPASVFNGNVAINGGLTVNGGASGPGNATFNGYIHTTLDVVAGTVSLQNHVHTGVQPGNGQTGAPVA
ncbi:MAG: phage baseplate assembly protein V [Azoarcus sp.]|nr:phage baseplate assembly protein V [Azoarcus sp.]